MCGRFTLTTPLDDLAVLTELLKPFAACSMDAYEVSSLVNKPQNDEFAYVLPLP